MKELEKMTLNCRKYIVSSLINKSSINQQIRQPTTDVSKSFKVGKFKKQIFLFSFELKYFTFPKFTSFKIGTLGTYVKTERNYFLIPVPRIQNVSNKVPSFLIWLVLEARAEFKK